MTDNERFWFDHLKAIDTTGCTTKAYADQHDLQSKDLYEWRRKFRARADCDLSRSGNVGRPPGRLISRRDIVDNPFAAIQVKPPVPVASTNCVVQCGVIRIEFGDVPSAAWIAALNEAVQRAI